MGNQTSQTYKVTTIKIPNGGVVNLNNEKVIIPNNGENNTYLNLVPNKKEEIRNFSKFIKNSDLTAAFKHFSLGGNNLNTNIKFLNFEKFNECISALLKFDIPILPHTYLADRLFNIMDKVILIEILNLIFIYF
jgi:hypothetical protein